MRAILLIALILVFSASEAAARHRHHSYYRHWSYGPRVLQAPPNDPYARSSRAYARTQLGEFPPSNWQLQPADPNWRGKRYVSPQGDAWLAFYSSPTEGQPVSAHLKEVAFADGEEIVALQASRLQLVVNGVKGDRAFYRQARIACGGEQWHHVALEFPFTTDVQIARTYERLVAQAARALELSDNDGCAPPVARNE
jgi:hypothetical protein